MAVDLLRSRNRLKASIRTFTSTFEQSPEDGAAERRNGLTLDRLDAIRVQCAQLAGSPAQWWHRIDEKIETYTSPEEIEGWFLTESPRAVLPYEVVVGRKFNAARFGAFPGILTGVGLMLTFVAILLALLGVHYHKTNSVEPISGIDILINGLSGKFLSSICALALSILFTLGEREVTVLDSLDVNLAKIMEATNRGLSDYNQSVEKNFTKICDIANDMVPKVATLLPVVPRMRYHP